MPNKNQQKYVNVLPNISEKISWLKKYPNILTGINRGIERETLRVTSSGNLSKTNHPILLGSPLTHKWITTDFAENLLEFITPIDQNIEHMLSFLRDIHRHVANILSEERMWPFSMPCFIKNTNNIKLARYGKSNIARLKTLYRKGLKTRYGSLMQIIAGVHYNFSLPYSFWELLAKIKNVKISKEMISNEYLNLIRNYYRLGWIIPYLFGSSPAICSSFLNNKNSNLPFEKNNKEMLFLPYATSLRLSNFGYSNKGKYFINLNSLSEYIFSLKQATITPYPEYVILGTKDPYGKWLQLNTNILQIENELYAPIRPKSITLLNNEEPSDSLLRNGIEYIEVRSLDINPFSAIGIDANQIRFLDLFLIWCILAESPKINNKEFQFYNTNWNKILLEGRKPFQLINTGYHQDDYSIIDIGKSLFSDLYFLAKILDKTQNNMKYQMVCDKLILSIYNPSYTYSARILQYIKNKGFSATGTFLANYYYNILIKEKFEVLNEKEFLYQAEKSIINKLEMENSDEIDFESYLYNKYKIN